MKKSFRLLAVAAVVLVSASPVVQAVSSMCEQYCIDWASQQAAQERDKVRGQAPMYCSQVPPSNYQGCINGRYQYAEYVYSYVYQSAYDSCMAGSQCGG